VARALVQARRQRQRFAHGKRRRKSRVMACGYGGA